MKAIFCAIAMMGQMASMIFSMMLLAVISMHYTSQEDFGSYLIGHAIFLFGMFIAGYANMKFMILMYKLNVYDRESLIYEGEAIREFVERSIKK